MQLHPEWTEPVNDLAGIQVVVAVTAFPSIAALFVALRIWDSVVSKRDPGWDDVLIVVSLVKDVNMTFESRQLNGVGHGLGSGIIRYHRLESRAWPSCSFRALTRAESISTGPV